MELRYQAVILGKKDIAETDRLYFVYSKEEGKIILVGKGVRRQGAKLAGFLEPLTLAEIFVSRNRGRGNITGAVVVENFSNIKQDFSAASRVFGIFSVLQKIIAEKEQDRRIFDLLLEYLFLMELNFSDENLEKNEKENRADLLGQAFLWKMLDFLGYKIETGRCVSCQEKLSQGNFFFSSRSGGVVCSKCQVRADGRISISPNAVKLLRIFWTNSLRNVLKVGVSEKEIQNLKLAVADFLSWVKS